jgi:uncharacterized protein (TIGR01244 family)
MPGLKTTRITQALTVSPQLQAKDFAALAGHGVRTIINNRPDGEEPGQLPAAEAARLAAENGMKYRHIPVTLATLSADSVRLFAETLTDAKGPVHAHCRSGQRSAIRWALGEIMAGRLTRDEAQARVGAGGYDLKPGFAWLDRHQAEDPQ